MTPRPFIVATILLVATPATALDFDCDTPGASYSAVTLSVSGGNFPVEADIQPKVLRTGEKWQPTAGIAIMSADNKRFLSYRISLTDDDRFGAVWSMAGMPMPNLVGLISKNEKTRLSILVDGDAAILKLGSKSQRVDGLGFVPSAIRLTCSSGNFLFSDTRLPLGAK